MRKVTKAETAEFRKKLAASGRTHRKIMKELMDAAHSAKDNNGFSNHARADVSLDAFMSRVNAHVELIEKRGRFQHEEASLAVTVRTLASHRTQVTPSRRSANRSGADPKPSRLVPHQNCRLSSDDARMFVCW